jgi:transposase
VLEFFAAQAPCLVALEVEACGGAHYWSRRFREHGHEVKLMAPQFVKPYVKSNKNDMRDAEAIAEAVMRPTMRFVPPKAIEQQDVQSLHRVRERLIGARTALINEVHGLMNEYGLVLPTGVSKFHQAVVETLAAAKDTLTALSQEMFGKLVEEFVALEEQIVYYQQKLESLAKTHPECQRLMTIPGIGPITATVLIAAVGHVGRRPAGAFEAVDAALPVGRAPIGGQRHAHAALRSRDAVAGTFDVEGEIGGPRVDLLVALSGHHLAVRHLFDLTHAAILGAERLGLSSRGDPSP